MEVETCRCPSCAHVSTVKVGDDLPYVSMYAEPSGSYFICQNPKCEVERIYGSNCVVTSK